jgi:enediyne biosynthesis protein E4
MDGAGHKHCVNQNGKVIVWAAKGTRSSVVFDMDDDGDLDIVTNDFNSSPMVLVSNLQEQHDIHYLKLVLNGSKSNRDGLGAICRVKVGDQAMTMVHDGKSGYLSQSQMPLYFGLGEADHADQITIEWPSGIQQVLEGPLSSNQTLVINEADSVTN